ncbi:unnamed protein product [Calypogeia fissa]
MSNCLVEVVITCKGYEVGLTSSDEPFGDSGKAIYKLLVTVERFTEESLSHQRTEKAVKIRDGARPCRSGLGWQLLQDLLSRHGLYPLRENIWNTQVEHNLQCHGNVSLQDQIQCHEVA